MRAAFVLALILSVAAPPLASSMAAAASASGAAESALAPPAGALCKLVRDSAKAEKTFSGGWFAAAAQRVAMVPAIAFADVAIAHTPQSHALAIDSPPLAPRPPPLV
jgi:hypothetical protein